MQGHVGIIKSLVTQRRCSIRTDEKGSRVKSSVQSRPSWDVGRIKLQPAIDLLGCFGIWDGQVLGEPTSSAKLSLRHQYARQVVNRKFYIQRHVQFLSLYSFVL